MSFAGPAFGSVRPYSVMLCVLIVLSVLRFTTSDYPFGVFKLAMHMTRAGLTQIGSIARNWVPHLRAGIIYPRLFQYTQHHTVGPIVI
jgi:hypothetical protein